jgi:peptide/nickel transport system substrate-binding protein
MELWHKVHDIIADDQPYTFLFNSKSLVFVNNRVGNVKTSKLGTNFVLLNPMPIPFYSVPGK